MSDSSSVNSSIMPCFLSLYTTSRSRTFLLDSIKLGPPLPISILFVSIVPVLLIDDCLDSIIAQNNSDGIIREPYYPRDFYLFLFESSHLSIHPRRVDCFDYDLMQFCGVLCESMEPEFLSGCCALFAL